MSSSQSISNSNNVMTLADLAALSGGDSIQIGKKQDTNNDKKAFETPFLPDAAYDVQILEQSSAVSKGGYDQVKLLLGIISADGSINQKANVWISLPIFSEALSASGDVEKLKYLKERFGKNLHSLLRATDPEVYNVYAKAEKDGKKWKFTDFAGEEMTKAEVTTREKLLGKAVIGTAAALRDGKVSLVGKRVFYVRKTDTNKQNSFFDNFYAEQPTSVPMANV